MVSRFVSRERNRVECSPVWPMMAAFVPRFHPSDSRVESNRIERGQVGFHDGRTFDSWSKSKRVSFTQKRFRRVENWYVPPWRNFWTYPSKSKVFRSKLFLIRYTRGMCLREERRKLDPPGAVKKSKIMKQGWKVGRDIGWSVSRHKEQRPFPLSSNLVL